MSVIIPNYPPTLKMDFFQRRFLICLMTVELWRDFVETTSLLLFDFTIVSPSPVPYLHPFWELGVLLLVVECRGSAHMLEILIGALSRQPSLAAVTLNLQSRDFVLNRTNRRSRLT